MYQLGPRSNICFNWPCLRLDRPSERVPITDVQIGLCLSEHLTIFLVNTQSMKQASGYLCTTQFVLTVLVSAFYLVGYHMATTINISTSH